VFKSREGANEEKMGYLLVGNEALEKLGWYESMIFQLGFLAAFLLIFFIAILALPASFLVNWKKAHKTALTQLVSTWMCWFASAVNVAFIASFALLIFTAVWYGFNPVQKAIFILPFISPVLCTASIAIMEVNQHSRKAPQSWTKPATAYILLISVVEVGFMVWLNYWNLLGIPF
jgi:hypothetical protein